MNIFIHHRDLRIEDNTTLNFLTDQDNSKITPIFIFTPQQITDNKYFSNTFVKFMCKGLLELKRDYKKKKGELEFFFGDTLEVLKQIESKNEIRSVSYNHDYSPFALKRDKEIDKWAEQKGIQIHKKEDILLIPILDGATMSKSKNEPYKVFTPYFNFLKNNKIDKPVRKSSFNFGNLNTKGIRSHISGTTNQIESYFQNKIYKENKDIEELVKPGRKEGIKLLYKIRKEQKYYKQKRDYFTYQTTLLSAHINLGFLSMREVYWYVRDNLGKSSGIITELFWRDFYFNHLYFFPELIKEWNNGPWNNSSADFNKWKNGETGFPVIDAAMRQLNKTGYMHNRLRMIVADFLTKHLFISWKKGEKYFANNLRDYSISSNNLNWQWISGTGYTTNPYFRHFNPWSQGEKYDKDCEFIKKWIPELNNIPAKDIHKWYKNHENYDIKYPKPMELESDKKSYKVFYEKYLKR